MRSWHRLCHTRSNLNGWTKWDGHIDMDLNSEVKINHVRLLPKHDEILAEQYQLPRTHCLTILTSEDSRVGSVQKEDLHIATHPMLGGGATCYKGNIFLEHLKIIGLGVGMALESIL